MVEIMLITLYGVCGIGGVFLASVWGRILWRSIPAVRRGIPPWRSVLHDTYFLIALGLVLEAIGGMVVFFTRAFYNGKRGLDQSVLSGIGPEAVIVGLFIMGFSQMVLMFAHDPQRQGQAYKWYYIVSALWMILCPLYLVSGR